MTARCLVQDRELRVRRNDCERDVCTGNFELIIHTFLEASFHAPCGSNMIMLHRCLMIRDKC